MAWVEKRGQTYRGRYKDGRGRSYTAGSSQSKREALRMAREKESEILRGAWVDPTAGRITLDEYFTRHWLPTRILERNTLSTYESHYRASIQPELGHHELRAITPSMVQAWVTRLTKQGLRPATVRAKFGVLSAVFDAKRGASAVRDRRVSVSPCRGIDLPTGEPRKVGIFQPEQIDALREHFDGWWWPLIHVAIETGLRWGEVIALRPADVDADARLIRVERTIIEVAKEKSGNGTRFAIKDVPKSGKRREVAISQELADYLRELAQDRGLASHDHYFAMPARGTDERDEVKVPVVTSVRTGAWPMGEPVSRSHFRDIWSSALSRAGLPPLRFHDLRSSHISWMLAAGVDVPTVMKRAGHTQITTTQRYTQALSGSDHRAVQALATMRSKAS